MDNTKSLYLDYQATTPVAEEVFLKMQPYFSEFFANPHSADHMLGWKSSETVENAKQQVANLISADRDEIIFTSGATEANNLAILGYSKRSILKGSSRKRILLSAIEHKSVLSVGRVLEAQYGFTVESIPVDQNGHIVSSELERMLGDDVLIVSIMAVNNEIGTIQDIPNLSEIVRANGIIFHCDATQAPLAMVMQDFSQHVDMLSLSGHKMYGPKGIGALYIRRDLQGDIEPLFYGGDQQNRLRPGTIPTPLCVGLGAAAVYISSDETNRKRKDLRELRDMFLDMLLELPWATRLYGAERDKRHPGNISIEFTGFNAQDVLIALQPYIAASTSSACASGIPEPSHVLKAIGFASKAESVIRFSLGLDSTEEEVNYAVKKIDETLNRLFHQR